MEFWENVCEVGGLSTFLIMALINRSKVLTYSNPVTVVMLAEGLLRLEGKVPSVFDGVS